MTKQQRIFKWLNIFLLIINISAFFTMLISNRQESHATTQKYKTDEFLRSELELTPEQYKKTTSLNIDVFRLYQVFVDKKCELNFQLIDQLSSEEPSTAKMDSLANLIGKMDGAIKRQTIRHFENVRSVCNDEQKEKLNYLLRGMMNAGDQCSSCNKIDCARRDRLKEK